MSLLVDNVASHPNEYLTANWTDERNMPWVMPTLTPIAPPAQQSLVGSVLVFDAVDAEWVLFGGYNVTLGTPTNQTWIYKDSVWTNLTGHSGVPMPALFYLPGFYDPALSKVVVWGGESSTFTFPNQTYEFSGGVWSDASLTAGGPPNDGNLGAADNGGEWAVWDASDGYGFLYYEVGLLNDLSMGGSQETTYDWELDSSNVWVNLSALMTGSVPVDLSALMAYNPGDATVWFGAGYTTPIVFAQNIETHFYRYHANV